MENKEKVNEFYKEVSEIIGKEAAPDMKFADLYLTSSKYYMIIAVMEDLGAEDVTYKMVKKCETIADAADLMLENLDE